MPRVCTPAEGEQPAARDVEQRHRIYPGFPGPHADGLGGQAGVVGQPPVGEHGGLGATGRARGEQDLRRARRIDLRQPPAVSRRAEAVPLVHRDHLAQPGQPIAHLGQDRRQRVAAVSGGEEDPGRAGVPEHVREFVGLVGRVDGHQRQAGQPGGEFQQHPFGTVAGPHRDRVAGLETRQQRMRGALSLGQQVVVGPLPPGRAGITGYQRRLVGGTFGGGAQDAADRSVQHRCAGVSRPVGRGQGRVRHGDRSFGAR